MGLLYLNLSPNSWEMDFRYGQGVERNQGLHDLEKLKLILPELKEGFFRSGTESGRASPTGLGSRKEA